LIVTEIALALIPLAGAGLLLRSLGHLLAIDPGFRAENVLTANYTLPARTYVGEARMAQYGEQLAASAAALPGVQHAGVISPEPLGDSDAAGSFEIEGRPLPPGVDPSWTEMSAATPGYFPAAGIPLTRGRNFAESDRANTVKVAVVSETFVRRFFGGQNPIGQRIIMGYDPQNPREIVGVVGNVRARALDADLEPQIYFPFAQQPLNSAAIFVRSSSAPEALVETLRNTARQIDPQIPLYRLRTLDQAVTASLARPRFTALLLVTFAVCALIIAAAGVYGVLSYIVTERKREIGIRLALGARPADILRLFVGHGTRLALLGITFGLAGALALGRTLSGLLFNTAPNDALTLAVVTSIIGIVAVLACYIPARRAARLDPVETLQ
jgi:predicted permease